VNERRDLGEIRLDRIAAEQILDLDLPEGAHALLAGENLV